MFRHILCIQQYKCDQKQDSEIVNKIRSSMTDYDASINDTVIVLTEVNHVNVYYLI
jgi:hypothetical protein